MQKIAILFSSVLVSVLGMSFNPSSLLTPVPMPVAVAPNAAVVSWVKDMHDFGTITLRVPVTVEFSFTNSGDAPLIIEEVITSCGCTASDYTKEPIMPGKKSTIKVNYNAANPGAFTKTITVKSNAVEGVKLLTIKGTVK